MNITQDPIIEEHRTYEKKQRKFYSQPQGRTRKNNRKRTKGRKTQIYYKQIEGCFPPKFEKIVIKHLN